MKATLKVLLACMLVSGAVSASAQVSRIRDAGRKMIDERAGESKTAVEEGVSGETSPESTSSGPVKKPIPLEDKSYNIVFSSTAIEPMQTGSLQKEFSSGDHIYALASLPKAFRQYHPNAKPEAQLDVEIFLYHVSISPYEWITDPVEEQLTFVNMKASGTILDNNYLLVDLVPDPESTNAYGNSEITYRKFGQKYDGPVAFAETLAEKLEPGEHYIKVVLKTNYEDIATGMFKIVGDDFSVYTQKAGVLNEMAASAGARSTVMPKAERSDPAMERQMIATVKGSNAWANKRLDATDILRVNIYDADWYIRRHELTGAILHRYIRATMAVKTQSGECAYYIVTFQEDYIGGSFQPMKYDGAGDKVMMVCENVSK